MSHIEQDGQECAGIVSTQSERLNLLRSEIGSSAIKQFFFLSSEPSCLTCEVLTDSENIQPKDGEECGASAHQNQDEEKLEALPRTS